jgi:hypothetical protein
MHFDHIGLAGRLREVSGAELADVPGWKLRAVHTA